MTRAFLTKSKRDENVLPCVGLCRGSPRAISPTVEHRPHWPCQLAVPMLVRHFFVMRDKHVFQSLGGQVYVCKVDWHPSFVMNFHVANRLMNRGDIVIPSRDRARAAPFILESHDCPIWHFLGCGKKHVCELSCMVGTSLAGACTRTS